MSNYTKGRTFEYDRKAYFESQGNVVMRTAGSHGPFDLIAVSTWSGTVKFIQCKCVQTAKHAERLVKEFKANPPLPILHTVNRGSGYMQAIVVKVKGGTIIEGWV